MSGELDLIDVGARSDYYYSETTNSKRKVIIIVIESPDKFPREDIRIKKHSIDSSAEQQPVDSSSQHQRFGNVSEGTPIVIDAKVIEKVGKKFTILFDNPFEYDNPSHLYKIFSDSYNVRVDDPMAIIFDASSEQIISVVKRTRKESTNLIVDGTVSKRIDNRHYDVVYTSPYIRDFVMTVHLSFEDDTELSPGASVPVYIDTLTRHPITVGEETTLKDKIAMVIIDKCKEYIKWRVGKENLKKMYEILDTAGYEIAIQGINTLNGEEVDRKQTLANIDKIADIFALKYVHANEKEIHKILDDGINKIKNMSEQPK